MKTRVPRSVVFFALLLLFAAEHLAFLPPVLAQGAPASAAAPLGPRAAVGRQLPCAATCRRCWRAWSRLAGQPPPLG